MDTETQQHGVTTSFTRGFSLDRRLFILFERFSISLACLLFILFIPM